MKKILYVTTLNRTINAFLIPHIKMLIDKGYKVDCACNIEQQINSDLTKMGVKTFQISFTRNPLDFKNLKAYKELIRIQEDGQYDIVHVHTPIASLYGRLLKLKFPKIKTIYTAHGFHFFNGAPWKNWLLYYPIEKVLSRITDNLITINKEDFLLANKSFSAKNTMHIPGVGLDTEELSKKQLLPIEKSEFGVKEQDLILLSVGELNDNKNHILVLNALKEIDNKNLHYFIVGIGPNEELIKKYCEEYGLSDRVHLLGYRNDVIRLMKISDIFIFPSQREGLPVSVMEAMFSELPIICSNIRGNLDLVDLDGGILFRSNNLEEITQAINELIDCEKRNKMGQYNKEKIKEYCLESVLEKLEEVY